MPLRESDDLRPVPARDAALVVENRRALVLAVAAGKLAAVGDDGQFVRKGGVVVVEDVLDLRLPVTAELIAVDAAGKLDRPFGCALDDGVDAFLHERRQCERIAVRREAGEHEAAVFRHARHPHHAEFRRRQVERRAIAAARGNGVEIAIRLEAPAVIGAAEAAHIAAGDVAYERAAMAAAIVEDVDLAVLVPDQDDRIAADIACHEIADLRHLAFVPDINERAPEDALHFEVEDRGVLEHAAMNPIVADERCDRRRQCRKLRHGRAFFPRWLLMTEHAPSGPGISSRANLTRRCAGSKVAPIPSLGKIRVPQGN